MNRQNLTKTRLIKFLPGLQLVFFILVPQSGWRRTTATYIPADADSTLVLTLDIGDLIDQETGATIIGQVFRQVTPLPPGDWMASVLAIDERLIQLLAISAQKLAATVLKAQQGKLNPVPVPVPTLPATPIDVPATGREK